MTKIEVLSSNLKVNDNMVPPNLKVDGNNQSGEKWKDFLSSRFGEREAASVSFAKGRENASKEVKISSSSGFSVDEP